MSRFRAAGIHLIFSGLVVFILLIIMFGVWYPGKYFDLMGGDGLIYLIVGIDLCIGPLLTFAIFKTGKKSLKFDLSVIAILQISALMYGSYTMFIARPVFTAYYNGEFQIATADEISDAELEKSVKPEWKKRSLLGPILVSAVEPEDKKDKADVNFVASVGAGLAQFPRLFVPYLSKQKEIVKLAKPLKELRKKDKNNQIVDQFLTNQKQDEENFIYLPISSAYDTMSAVLDAKTGKFIDILKINPL